MDDREQTEVGEAFNNDFQDLLIFFEMTLHYELQAWFQFYEPFVKANKRKRLIILEKEGELLKKLHELTSLASLGENILWREAQDQLNALQEMILKALNLDRFTQEAFKNNRFYRLFGNSGFFVSSLVLYAFLNNESFKRHSSKFEEFLDEDDHTGEVPLEKLVIRVIESLVSKTELDIERVTSKFIKFDRVKRLSGYRFKLKERLIGEARSRNKLFSFIDEEVLNEVSGKITIMGIEFIHRLVQMRYEFININSKANYSLRLSEDKHSLEVIASQKDEQETKTEKVHEIYFSREDKIKRQIKNEKKSRKRYGMR